MFAYAKRWYEINKILWEAVILKTENEIVRKTIEEGL